MLFLGASACQSPSAAETVSQQRALRHCKDSTRRDLDSDPNLLPPSLPNLRGFTLAFSVLAHHLSQGIRGTEELLKKKEKKKKKCKRYSAGTTGLILY